MTTKYEHQHLVKPDGLKDNIDNRDTPRVLHWLPAAFLLGVIGLGFLTTILTPAVRQWPVGKAVMNGAAMSEYEKKNLDPNVPWQKSSVNLWGGVNYKLFGEARDGAVIGKNGWLFTSEEFQTAKTDAAEIQNKVAYVKQVRDDLAKDNAKLVVALIPAKTRIYAAELGKVKQPAVWNGVYQDFRRQLEEADIPTPDLDSAFQQAQKNGNQVFLRTDTHWTPQGAELAAALLAATVRSLNPDLPPAEYSVTQKPEIKRKGDLLRYIPVPDGQGPAPDSVQEPTYQRTDEGGGGLLGDESLAVTLVGTSYSAETKDNVWHFDQALARELGSPVLNMAKEGLGPIVPMREYLQSQERKDNPPQVVVWEIPERFLRVNYAQ